ncbi:MAG: Serine/threonine-protein kinase PknD [Gemmatimonadaceae bacterium]|nr:Serine/threonine-protein kinase PknD [Gemmatimonadaceae bacterium]
MASSSISATRLIRIREVFDGALEVAPAEREEYVRNACGADDTLRAEVVSLLSALERGGDTWERPLGALLAAAWTDGEPSVVGHRIGPYDVTRLIGYGGMGAVYEGVRADDQFRKRVALKFLRRGLEGDLAIRRFRYERQILANLNHKNIAALLDGGVTADGQPYFVMEYVDGEAITQYCASRCLSIRDRVQLLRQVCAAVQHAHQNLVVHRDLKPGNILVTADGTVKLLDFGIAKLLREGEGSDQLPMTQGGIRAFTPDYASPEQVRGLPVAAASDVYSLGVIASEVLSGHRPFILDGLLFAEMQERVCVTPAPPPSALVAAGDAAGFGERSEARLRSQLRGDLDAIVRQALRKEPERRYGSAEQLGNDLRRYLEGHPVSAQRDRLGYRLGKLIRRRRVEAIAGVLVVVSLVGGIVTTTRQARRAETESAKMEQVNTFLITMLSAVDPGYQGRDVTVAQVLSQAASDVGKQKLDPEIEAAIRHTIGQTYYGLGLYDSATVHAERAYELRRRLYGELDQRTLTSISYVIALAEARGAFAQAESLARVTVDRHRRSPQRNPGELATALDNLARMVEQQGRLDEAMQIKLESIAIRRSTTDSASLEAFPYSLNNVAVSYQYRGEFAKADSLVREALGVEARVHGKTSPNYGDLLRTLASIRDESGKGEEADSLIRESLRVLRASLGPNHANYLRSLNMHAMLRYGANDLHEAVAAAREVTAAIGNGLPEGDQTAAIALQVLGLALDSLGQHFAADSALRRSQALREKYLPPDHWLIASSRAVTGYHLGLMGRRTDGEAGAT